MAAGICCNGICCCGIETVVSGCTIGIDGMPDGLPLLYHHLPLRLPWLSLPGSIAGLPTRPDTKTVKIHGLPAPRPDDLGPAAAAFDHARAAMAALLDGPCDADVLEHRS